VRLYRTGRIWIRAICENGYLDVNTVDKNYVPAVTIGLATVYTNGGASLSHYANTRWDVEGWIGGDPQIHTQTQWRTAHRDQSSCRTIGSATRAKSPQRHQFAVRADGPWTVDPDSGGYGISV